MRNKLFLIFFMQILGLGFAGCNKFCRLIDFSCQFLRKLVYSSYPDSMYTNIKTAAGRFFQTAAKREVFKTCKKKNLTHDDIAASGDETWQKMRCTCAEKKG